MKFLFTLGQNHTHRFGTITLDCDGVIEVDAEDSERAREKMFDLFDQKWSMQYGEGKLDMSYFPRGIILRLEA